MVENPNLTCTLRSLSGSTAERQILSPVELAQEGDEALTVTLQNETPQFPEGTLVELSLPERLYLGEIVAREGTSATIRPEHTLAREALTEIRKAWRQVASLP